MRLVGEEWRLLSTLLCWGGGVRDPQRDVFCVPHRLNSLWVHKYTPQNPDALRRRGCTSGGAHIYRPCDLHVIVDKKEFSSVESNESKHILNKHY